MSQRPRLVAQIDQTLVRGLIEFGPRDLNKLSRMLNIPYNTALSSYRRLRDKFGLRIYASPNTGLLGLTHAFFEITLSREYRRTSLKALENICSLNYLAVDAGSPSELFGVLYVPAGEPAQNYPTTLFDMLVEEGFLESYSVKVLPKICRYSVRAECVDWRTGEYSFDWDSLTARPSEEEEVFDPSLIPQADEIDLLILKELEHDASKSFPEISKQLLAKHGLKISDRLLLYHYSNHVVKNKMFSKYRVDFSHRDKLGVYIVAQTEDLKEYLNQARKSPYLTRELYDPLSGYHFSEHYLHPKDYPAFLKYLQLQVAPLTLRLKTHVSISESRSMFTIPFELFDEEEGIWKHNAQLDAERVLVAARKLEA